MENKETIFRQKSIDKVSSPEQLDSYLKVTSPSVWLVLIGIIIIMVGAISWGALGKLKTYTMAGCAVEYNVAYCYVKEDDGPKVEKGMTVEIPSEKVEFNIISKENTGFNIPSEYDYLLHIIGITPNDYVFGMYGYCTLPDGYYAARIVTESITPLEFILN